MACHWATEKEYLDFEQVLRKELKDTPYLIETKPDKGYAVHKATKEKSCSGQYDLIWLDVCWYPYNAQTGCYEHEFGDLGAKQQRKETIFPLKQAMFEGVLSNVPNDMTAYLTHNYGYLGKDCRYDKELKAYVKREKVYDSTA